jgi:beta-lactamase regulating signal transducer with metallopeptidase domain
MDWVSWSNIARELVAWMADASARAVVLAMLALLLVPIVRRSSTAQHAVWTVVLAGMLVLPFLRPVAPPIHIHLRQVQAPVRSSANPPSMPAAMSPPRERAVAPSKPGPSLPPTWPLFVVAAYLAGVVLFGARLLGGVVLTRRALHNTRTIHSELWEHYELIADANVDLSLEESDSVRVPLTTGSDLMRVIFPADWRAWPAEKRTTVLAHELAHARRRDPLVALVVAVNKCLFWFHPLAWWLERRLPVLAEHAADDAALTVSFDTQAYARLLLDSAARLDNGGSRLIWHAAAMSGPVVAERIRRVLDVPTVERLKPIGKIGRALFVCFGATLLWISTAVDVPRLVAGQANGLAGVKAGAWPPWLPTAEQAAAMEQQLAANPEDEATRRKLLQYYGFVSMCAEGRKLGLPGPPECSDSDGQQVVDRRIPLILWLIDHHPESELLGEPSTLIIPQRDSPNAYEEFRNHWLTQVNLHPDDARVLVNAASAFRSDSPRELIDLLRRARALDPKRATEPLARNYSTILVYVNETGTDRLDPMKDPGLAAEIRNELQSSNDVALLGLVARQVVEGAAAAAMNHSGNWDFNRLRILAIELVTHAQTLQPENREWSDLMEGVKQLPAGAVPPAAQAAPAGVQTIRIGGTIAGANLQQSSPPIYPPLAKAAHVQDTVKLQILIGTDGHVKETTTISGHPLLITAAMDAAKQYVYKPTMLNGQAAQVQTEVEIVF